MTTEGRRESAQSWDSPRGQENLQFKVVDEGPPRYPSRTDKPVEYMAVANEARGVIGYLWANDSDGAAGWIGRKAAGPDSFNGARLWMESLSHYKARGLPPSQALALLAAHRGGDRAGRVVAGSRARADSLVALRAIAAADQAQPGAPEHGSSTR